MKRYICLVIHTERLHDDKLWKRIQKLLKIFKKFNVRASWFSINPAFSGYQAMGFDEAKWKERLKFLAENNQFIEQHSHFYKGEEGVPKGKGYDLSPENVLKRIREDRKWLSDQGYEVKGFLSGAWKINEEILKILAKEGYKYDLSQNNLNLKEDLFIKQINGILEIPATANIKRLFLDFFTARFSRRFLKYKGNSMCPVHFHDYDLASKLNYWLLIFLILISTLLKYKFTSIKEFYDRNFAPPS